MLSSCKSEYQEKYQTKVEGVNQRLQDEISKSIERLVERANTGQEVEDQDFFIEDAALQNEIDSIKRVIENRSDREETASSYISLGYRYEEANNFELAVKYKFKGFQEFSIEQRHSVRGANLLSSIGRDYYKNDSYPTAIEYYEVALALYESLGYTGKRLGRLYHYMGSVFKRENLFPDALKYYTKEYELSVTNNDPKMRAESLYLISQVIPDHKQALEYQLESLEVYDSLDNDKMKNILYQNVAETYSDLGQDNMALAYSKRALEYDRQLEQPTKLFSGLVATAEIHLDLKNYPAATQLLNEASQYIHRVKEKKTLRVIDFYQQQYRLNKGIKNYERALAYHEKYMEAESNILNQESISTIEGLEKRYDTQKKELEIELLRAENEREMSLIALNQKIIAGISVVLLAMTALGGILFKKNRLITKQKKDLDDSNKLIEQKNRNILDSIEYAKRIQDAMLPPPEEIKKLLPDTFVLYKPKDIVAGDFYWVETVSDEVLFAVADCTGHGVPGALLSVVCHNALHRAVHEFKLTEPAVILNKTKELVTETFGKSNSRIPDGMDIALCRLNRKGQNLEFAGANNPLYILRKSQIIETKADRQSIGLYPGFKPFSNHKISLEEGDQIVLSTDGFADQFGGENDKKLKSKNFKKLLVETSVKDILTQSELLNKSFEDWKGPSEQIDDVCVMGVKV